MEAARFWATILNGPKVANFDDIYKLLKSLKISKEVKKAEQIAQNMTFKKDIKKSKKIRSFGNIILKKTIQELNREIYNEI